MRLSVAFLLVALLAACSGEQAPLTADSVDVRLPRPGTNMGVAYLTIENTTAEAITITSVSSPQFDAVEMHETNMTEGVSRMRKLDSVTIPAKGSVAFERGGKHLMLMRPRAGLDNVLLTFHADAAPILSLSVASPE